MATTPRGYERFSTFSPQQQQIFGNLLSHLQSQLGGEGIERFQQPYLTQFQQNILPQIAEKYAGLGAGSQSSSAFQQELGSSAANLQEKLASLGASQQQNAVGLLLQLLGLNTEGLVKKEKPWWQQGLIGFGEGFGQGLGGALGSTVTGGLGRLGAFLGSGPKMGQMS